jgi:hypothetical protein
MAYLTSDTLQNFFFLASHVFLMIEQRFVCVCVCVMYTIIRILIPLLTVTHQMNTINSQLRQNRAYLLFYSNHIITV